MRISFESVLLKERGAGPSRGFSARTADSAPSDSPSARPAVRPLHSLIEKEEKGSAERIRAALLALRKGARGERVSAARSLGELAAAQGITIPEAVVPLCVSLAGDKDPSVREESAWSLWKLGDDRAHAALLKALVHDPSPAVREKAARALGLMGASVSMQTMLDLMALERHVPARVRAGIACALGYFACEPALGYIIRAGRDAEPYVRYEAVRSLGRFLVGFPGKISDRVFSILKKHLRPGSEPSGLIRRAAIKALRFSMSAEAGSAVAGSLARDPDESVREAAAEALLVWNAAESEAALIAGLSDDSWSVRKAAARTLARFIIRHGVQDGAAVSEALRRMERMLPVNSHEWRLAADAFASL